MGRARGQVHRLMEIWHLAGLQSRAQMDPLIMQTCHRHRPSARILQEQEPRRLSTSRLQKGFEKSTHLKSGLPSPAQHNAGGGLEGSAASPAAANIVGTT